MGWLAEHSPALRLRCVTGSNGDAEFGEGQIHVFGHVAYAVQGYTQIPADVVVECLERRDVENMDALSCFALVRMGAVALFEAGPGLVFFAAVVVLTMFAAMSFDPRLIWDK